MTFLRSTGLLATGLAVPALLAALTPATAEACGCLAPPIPTGLDDFAVNQQAEQIIFEVGQDSVSAHVLIRYAGSPEEFAWIVPVPNIPDLALSEAFAFPLIERETSPLVGIGQEWICPDPLYVCRYHEDPGCQDDNDYGESTGDGSGLTGSASDSGGSGPPEDPDGVDVHKMEMIGAYDTVTFSASDAQLAVNWLNDNGFIVNSTITPYMQPYIEADMVFVAAKLVAGAGVEEIRPLRITYAGIEPMIPLQLTAVAAEPHLTVSAFIYGEQPHRPKGRPSVTPDEALLGRDNLGRINYPMLVSRTVDEAGGGAFVPEYMGAAPTPSFGDDTGCCGGGGDWCGIGGDGSCQCPRDEFDADDCAEIEGLAEGIALVDLLAEQYPVMTRLTTRISPEEMTFDPVFQTGSPDGAPSGRLALSGNQYTLLGCENDIIEQDRYQEILDRMDCAAVYCGAGACAVTDDGVGCACDADQTARTFTDLDGLPSVTCVPRNHTVDFGADIELPDVCAGINCGMGACLDIGGFPTCACDDDHAAVVVPDAATPTCLPITQLTSTAGAADQSEALKGLPVCAPAPGSCGENGWLVPNDDIRIEGITCATSVPEKAALVIPPKPTCEDDQGGLAGCACRTDEPTGPGDPGWLLGLGVVFALRLPRPRRR